MGTSAQPIAVVAQYFMERQAGPLGADLAQPFDLLGKLLLQHLEGHLQMIGFALQARLGVEKELQQPAAQEREPVAEQFQELRQLLELAEHAARGVDQPGEHRLARQLVLAPEDRAAGTVRGQQPGGADLPVACQRPPQLPFIVAAAPALLQQPAAPAYRWRRFTDNPSYQQQVLFQLGQMVGGPQ